VVTIPDSVLDQIIEHRPHLGSMVRNLRANPSPASRRRVVLSETWIPEITRVTLARTPERRTPNHGR